MKLRGVNMDNKELLEANNSYMTCIIANELIEDNYEVIKGIEWKEEVIILTLLCDTVIELNIVEY